MNKTILCGRLIADPNINKSQSGTTIARYTIAVDRKFKQEGQPTADFIPCVALGKTGEFAEKYLKKGTKILVTGHIQTGSYTNKDGNKVYTTDVMVEEHEFVESKASQASAPVPQAQAGTDSFMSIPDGIDEELPFS